MNTKTDPASRKATQGKQNLAGERTQPDWLHLFIGTPFDNIQDRHNKGRSRGAGGQLNSHAKLTPSQVAEIRASNQTDRALAKVYGVSNGHISNIRTARRWNYEKAKQ